MSNEERRLIEVYKETQEDLKHVYLDFWSTPSASHFQRLHDSMLDYQTAYNELLAEREAIKAQEEKKSS